MHFKYSRSLPAPDDSVNGWKAESVISAARQLIPIIAADFSTEQSVPIVNVGEVSQLLETRSY